MLRQAGLIALFVLFIPFVNCLTARADMARGMLFVQENGTVVPEDKLLDVTWNIEGVEDGIDLTKHDEPKLTVIVIRQTAFETPIDDAMFYWGEDEWDLQSLKTAVSSETFLPAAVYKSSGKDGLTP